MKLLLDIGLGLIGLYGFAINKESYLLFAILLTVLKLSVGLSEAQEEIKILKGKLNIKNSINQLARKIERLEGDKQ